MMKHVGQHNQKKIVILYKTVPNEEHMCLVAYSDLLPRAIHDDIMKSLESPVGQQAKEFADALFRVTMADGRNALTALHQEGYIKKVPTNQVIVTPTAGSKVRLDELNSILMEMEKGEDAVKRLAELDAQSGVKDPKKSITKPATVKEVTTPAADVLTDEMLAQQRIDQAKRMRADAKTMLAEAMRLEAEAKTFVKVNKAPKAAKTTKTTSTKAPTKNARATKETPAKKAKVKES